MQRESVRATRAMSNDGHDFELESVEEIGEVVGNKPQTPARPASGVPEAGTVNSQHAYSHRLPQSRRTRDATAR